MTGAPSEQDVRAALPARAPRRTWLDQITRRADVSIAVAALDGSKPLHPGPGIAVLACGSCGDAIDAADMRRAVPPRDTARSSTVIHPIVCPLCTHPTETSTP